MSAAALPVTKKFVNPLKEKLKAGRPVFGIMATIPSVALTQIMVRAGFDYIVVDMEHAPIDINSAQAMIAVTAATNAVPVVRVPWNLPWIVKTALDVGAGGITFPLVRTKAEAESAISAMRYAPHGERGWGPFHTHFRWGVSMYDYVQQANEQLFTELLIEHVDAVDNLEEILSVPGIDTAFIAPGDLSVSLGVGGQLDHPLVIDTIARAEAAIRRTKAAMGGVAYTPEQANRLIDRGYRVITMGFDFVMMEKACAAALQDLRR